MVINLSDPRDWLVLAPSNTACPLSDPTDTPVPVLYVVRDNREHNSRNEVLNEPCLFDCDFIYLFVTWVQRQSVC
jgi:hypothetical protein